MPSPLRSFAAVFFGFVVMLISGLVCKLLFRQMLGAPSASPTAAYLAANLIFSCVPTALAGLVTAFLAPDRPLQHAYALAAVIFVIGALSYVHYAGAQPFWYQLVMQVIPPVCAIGGGFLVAKAVARHSR